MDLRFRYRAGGSFARRAVLVTVVGVIGIALCGCGSAQASSDAPSSTTAASSPDGTSSGSNPATTVWLCRPGMADDPCTFNPDATAVPPGGPRAVVDASPATDSPFDCFYVYPTVSMQKKDNANLKVQAGEVAAAVTQASRFSQVCRVWAPMYRQRTSESLAKGLGNDPSADAVAYQSLLAGWNDYLAHYNDGRPVIFIGHSQGAAMLIRLLSAQIDSDAALRGRMVSAIIAGGNVTVPSGRTVGSTFRHIPLCTSPGETGCVIAYSSFPSQPPANSQFGRPGQGVSLQSGQTVRAGLKVACVNPAALGGGAAALSPYFLTATLPPPAPTVSTPWVTYPDLYSAVCTSRAGATWLQIDTTKGAGDSRPTVTEALGPTWGYHLQDINLALGDLVEDVQMQEAAYLTAHG